MSAFFGEISPDLQRAFASEFHISEATLISAAKVFGEYSGELYPLNYISRARYLASKIPSTIS